MYEFKKHKPNGTCLLIDNHPIFGGFAKSNEFDVDGYRVAGPQGSINCFLPGPTTGDADDYWHELGLPDEFQFAQLGGGDPSIKFPKATSSAMYVAEQCATIGYYFRNPLTNGEGVWVKDIWDDNLKRAPWPEAVKKELLVFRDRKVQYRDDKDEPAWLDSITYGDFVTQTMGLSPEVLSYITPIMGVTGLAASSMPGVARFPGRKRDFAAPLRKGRTS
jgi:spermidine dehydrogenase